MAVKSYNRKASTKAQVNTHTRQSVKKSERNNSKLWIVFGLIAIIFITYISFTPSLHGTFTNWDDNGYVSENRAVKDLSSENIKHFITGYEMSNYHPVVMITYSLIYHYFKLSPFPYHFFNLFFHILNCLLLFFLIRKLSGKVTVSFIVSFLFALHPLHVESVSWISGTKDVLYTFFLIISLYSYLLYLEKKKFSPYYIYSLVFFILSCLSKAMAVVLPLLLFLIDYLHNRKADFRMFAEKIPFLLISLVMGIVTIYAQKSGNAIGEVTTTSFWQNLLIASHGILFYIYKMLLPYNLSAFYPYPNQVSGTLPFKFLIAPVFVFAIFGLIFWSKKYTKIIIFGFLFYLLNILQVLQILPVGNAIAAERY
ncbi:MAG: glycosyltransferase family 39 protein, partial [Bacteroidota bacterium]|nr:glycosyltransferase family 39 protein [Bacteroidota bacterium]